MIVQEILRKELNILIIRKYVILQTSVRIMKILFPHNNVQILVFNEFIRF